MSGAETAGAGAAAEVAAHLLAVLAAQLGDFACAVTFEVEPLDVGKKGLSVDAYLRLLVNERSIGD